MRDLYSLTSMHLASVAMLKSMGIVVELQNHLPNGCIAMHNSYAIRIQ